MLDFCFLYKTDISQHNPIGQYDRWDVFVAAYTSAHRARLLYDRVIATHKWWLVFPEYGYLQHELPQDPFFTNGSRHEADFIRAFWTNAKIDASKARICIDITGFIRPYLIFLVRWLHVLGVRRFDALYAEPAHYEKRENTTFSGDAIREVRQVAGCEGVHTTDISRDVLIVGVGYEDHLIAAVAENKNKARKIQLYGFPSLQADMYQENVLRVRRAEEAIGSSIGDENACYYAPANDPFVTASVLRDIVTRLEDRNHLTNLYLSPLATKAQVLGFTLYYIVDRPSSSTSVIFPFCDTYSRGTSKGVGRVWKYTIELP